MSVKVMAWVFEHSRSTLADRLVLLAIADHANHDGVDAWPSVDQIARKAHVGRSTVFNSIQRLVALGELKVFHKGGPDGKNSYQILTTQGDADGPNPGPSRIETVQDFHGTVQDLDLRPLYLNHPEPSLRTRAREELMESVRDLPPIVPTATLKRGEPIR